MSRRERAYLLLQQSRHDLAEKELRGALAENPNDGISHALLALCLAEQDKAQEAEHVAREAIRLEPDESFTHYVMAETLIGLGRYDRAEEAIRTALRRAPGDPDYFATLGLIHHHRSEWKDALEAAERGLMMDAEHVTCTNLRAMALNKLKRRVEADDSIAAALARDPENPLTHANRGWSLLEQGQHKRALESFREALRIQPDFNWAREGILEALRAKSFLYRMVLKYFFWMARLSARAQWGVIIGLYVAYQILRGIARSQPQLAPLITPILLAYVAFALMTWMAVPLFNLTLRLNRFGRLALDRPEIAASNWVGALLFVGIALLIAGAVVQAELFLAGLGCILMVIPVSGTYRARRPKQRRMLGAYTVSLAGTGLAAAACYSFNESVATGLIGIFFLGIFLFSWIANASFMRR